MQESLKNVILQIVAAPPVWQSQTFTQPTEAEGSMLVLKVFNGGKLGKLSGVKMSDCRVEIFESSAGSGGQKKTSKHKNKWWCAAFCRETLVTDSHVENDYDTQTKSQTTVPMVTVRGLRRTVSHIPAQTLLRKGPSNITKAQSSLGFKCSRSCPFLVLLTSPAFDAPVLTFSRRVAAVRFKMLFFFLWNKKQNVSV